MCVHVNVGVRIETQALEFSKSLFPTFLISIQSLSLYCVRAEKYPLCNVSILTPREDTPAFCGVKCQYALYSKSSYVSLTTFLFVISMWFRYLSLFDKSLLCVKLHTRKRDAYARAHTHMHAHAYTERERRARTHKNINTLTHPHTGSFNSCFHTLHCWGCFIISSQQNTA